MQWVNLIKEFEVGSMEESKTEKFQRNCCVVAVRQGGVKDRIIYYLSTVLELVYTIIDS